MTIMALTKENFDQVIDSNDLVVIDFWAEWCVPCHSFATIYEQVANKHPEIIFGKIDTEAQPELAAEFTIRSIPTVMILRQKIMIFCESGLLPATALEDLVQQAMALDMEEVRKQLGEMSK